mgnify:FL=1
MNGPSLVEAILYLENDTVDVKTIMKAGGLSESATMAALEELRERYNTDAHGLELVQLADGYTFRPKRELWEQLRERYGKKNERRLSRAALETLSIVAYSQPITRAEIENLRGVAADGMIRLLLGRSLIKEIGRKDAPGRPLQYGTTREFLKAFNLASIAELPGLDELDQERFELHDS